MALRTKAWVFSSSCQNLPSLKVGAPAVNICVTANCAPPYICCLPHVNVSRVNTAIETHAKFITSFWI